MTEPDLFRLVQRMRAAQKQYFRSRTHGDLEIDWGDRSIRCVMRSSKLLR